jgi:hypothetical protein
MKTKRILLLLSFFSCLLVGVAAVPRAARAEGTIKNPDDHPHYIAELEPHVLFRDDNYFNNGFGVGGRVSFPIVDPGFIKTINNTIAIGTGLDVFFLNYCYYRNEVGCGETLFGIPLVMQWNFYVAPHISVFGEPGFQLYFYNYNGCPPGVPCANPYNTTHFAPFFFDAGMRYHFNETIAITPRIMFDNYGAFGLSFGVSFFLGHK